VHGVVRVDGEDGGDVLANGLEQETARGDPADDRAGVDGEPRLRRSAGGERGGQVDPARSGDAPGGDAAGDPRRDVGPRLADRQVGRDDER